MSVKYFNRNPAYPGNIGLTQLPEQAIPSSKKNKKWKKDCMDALENIGMIQMRENAEFKDIYQMLDGKLSYMEVKDMMPQLREIAELREDMKIPTFFKHYDLLGTVANAFIGWLTQLGDKYHVEGTDENEVNEYLYTKSYLLTSYLQQEWDRILQQRLVQMGIDPNLNEFETEEEGQAYIQEVQNIKISLTPPAIEQYMNSNWKSIAAKYGDATLKADRERFSMDDIDIQNFRDYIATGRCFRNHFVGYDYYKPEAWSPLNTFYSKTLDSKFPQYGEYIGRIHYMTHGQVISRYGQRLTASQKKKIIGGNNPFGSNGVDESQKKYSAIPQYKGDLLPFEGYHDYQNGKAIEDLYGVPIGRRHSIGKDGKEEVTPRFLPDLFGNGRANLRWADHLSLDGNVRTDMYQVTEAYWISYDRVFVITYQDESGLVTQEIVTDELLPEFLEENGLKKVKITMQEANDDPQVNTYFEEYVPRARYGVKISGGVLFNDPIYLDCEPIEKQLKGDGNMYDTLLPVSGYIGESILMKAYPWQFRYNLELNTLQNIEEKEIGKFLLTDINFIPSEYNEYGDTEDAMWHLIEVAKNIGLAALDTSRLNQQGTGGTPFNQFAVYNMAETDRIKQKIELAENAKRNLFEQFGLTQQLLNTPTGYETAEGIKQGQNSQLLQMMPIYSGFDTFKKKTLEIHLDTAQQCDEDRKDISILYRKNDLSLAFLKMNTEGLSLKKLGVRAVSNSKNAKKLEQLRQVFYNIYANGQGSDVLDLANIMTAESIVELEEAAEKARLRADQVNQRAFQEQQQLQQQAAEIKEQADSIAHERDKELIVVKGEIDLRKAAINAAGRAADKDSDQTSLDFVRDMADINIRKAEMEKDETIRNKEIEEQRADREYRKQKDDADRQLKERALDLRERERGTKEFTSLINKN